MPRDLVEGETKPIDVTLYDGEGASRGAIDGTGLTVTLQLRDRQGGVVITTGLVSWLGQSVGTVRYEPAIGDFTAARSPYEARFKVTDANGDDAYYPNGEPDIWKVRK